LYLLGWRSGDVLLSGALHALVAVTLMLVDDWLVLFSNKPRKRDLPLSKTADVGEESNG
jgi:hypothetical protein